MCPAAYLATRRQLGDEFGSRRVPAVNGYRFSIIPAAAVTDEALEPRDLQVLCLIGRHTDRNGWCRRSQVKMADELRCGRATVQRALERLYDARYLQRKLEGTRRGEPPAEGEQPFRAHSYRVLMDRDAAADELAQVTGVPTSEHPGVPIHGQGVPAIHGHGVPIHTRAPSKGPSFKRTPLNLAGDEIFECGPEFAENEPACTEPFPEKPAGQEGLSKTPSDEERIKYSGTVYLNGSEKAQIRGAAAEPSSTASLAEFQAAWGTSAIDNVNRTMRAWGALTIEQRHAALAGIKPFKAELERAKRTHSIAGWRYLEEKRWELLAVSTGEWVDVKRLSRDWWALLFAKIERGEPVASFAEYTLNNFSAVPVKRDAMPTFDQVARLEAYPADGDAMKAWRPWLEARRVRFPHIEKLWVFLPGIAPPSDTKAANHAA
jgi:hypothetical protein